MSAVPFRVCPDTARCWHDCKDDAVCWRVGTCEPLSGTRVPDQWDLTPVPDQPAAGMVRRDASDTSKLAALRVAPATGTQRRRLLELLAANPAGLTDEQMQQDANMVPNAQRPRRRELVMGGWVRPTDQRRPTDGGGEAIVWALARPLPPG